MSENDIEFDFFEEPDTRETAEERPRRRGQRPPVRPPTGLTPLLRLIGLISFAILIVLLLVLWVNGCREDKRKDAYRDYVTTVRDYANQSQRLGRQFNTLLTSRGTKESDVESELAGLAGQQDQITNNARNLDPPGHLRDQDSHMLEAFELRSNGLRGMSDAFQSTASSKNADAAGSDLALQMQRFIASDVLWQDFFKEPTKEELQKIGVTGVNVPDSVFLRNPDIATASSMKSVWQRVHGAGRRGERRNAHLRRRRTPQRPLRLPQREGMQHRRRRSLVHRGTLRVRRTALLRGRGVHRRGRGPCLLVQRRRGVRHGHGVLQ